MKLDQQILLLIFGVLLTLSLLLQFIKAKPQPKGSIRFICFFLFILVIASVVSLRLSTWLWGFFCFFLLREFFSLVQFRLQDRFAIVIAYCSIPCMLRCVHLKWYDMFIIVIPVYTFLAVILAITLGGKEKKGAVTSIGVIFFGLFLFVYSIGHIAYLSSYNVWLAALVILCIMFCDIIGFYAKKISLWYGKLGLHYLLASIFTIPLALLLAKWCDISLLHASIIGAIIPILSIISEHTVLYLEDDLGMIKENLKPGTGFILDNVKSLLYVAPVVFHYYRHFCK